MMTVDGNFQLYWVKRATKKPPRAVQHRHRIAKGDIYKCDANEFNMLYAKAVIGVKQLRYYL